MATNVNPGATTTPETPITVKVTFNGVIRKFKLPLKELNVNDFSKAKVRSLLGLTENQEIRLERFSDSSGGYLVLDPSNPSAYKQLYRAAKAKLKLRIRATLVEEESVPKPDQAVNIGQTLEQDAFNKANPSSTSDTKSKGPVTFASTDTQSAIRNQFFEQLANISRERELGLRMKEPTSQPSFWQVYCNSCDKVMADTHFHCSICDEGDYDLCQACVDSGKTCPGEDHWLIKRSIKNGKMVNSTTQTFAPKIKREPETKKEEMPGAFKAESKVEAPEPEASRTCNACVRVLPEDILVTCKDCEDYDICMSCHVENKHGHHPAHTFKPVNEKAKLSKVASTLLNPGRNVRHQAICDGCNATIYGVRHKCLNCPDWDYCNNCFEGSSTIHSGHRFVPVYGPLSGTVSSSGIHYGIYCDGPLCSSKMSQSYIRGIRYKCSICHDTDFCANCEAHPSNTHNQTHPLIKFKTQVRNVTVTTLGETKDGESMGPMGDKKPASVSFNAPKTNPTPSPLDDGSAVQASYPTREHSMRCIKGSFRVPITSDKTATSPPSLPPAYTAPVQQPPKYTPIIDMTKLDAHFIRDTITDGSTMSPNSRFVQKWTLHNPGPYPWPVGTQIQYFGGDNMLDVDHSHPATSAALAHAQRGSILSGEVPIGAEFDFVAMMRAPQYEGKYISYWRLKAPDGTLFGHKLWCHIQVKTMDDENGISSTEYSGLKGHPKETPIQISQNDANGSANMSQREKTSNGGTGDYQMQLLLLEQQNKKRLQLAREAAAAAQNSMSESSTAEHLKQQQRRLQQLIVARHQAVAARVATEQAKSVAPVVPQAPESFKEKPIEAENNAGLESSTMVFPKLEKESPASSIHQDIVPPQPESNEAPISSAATETETQTTADDNFEEVDNLEFSDSDGEDDGFLTDEEYDILDASDEEIVDADHPNV